MNKLIQIAAAAAIGLAVPAFANAEEVSVKVSYADLNLRSEAGVQQLQRRIARAVSRVCGDYAGVHIGDWPSIQRCRNNAQRMVAPQLAAALRKYSDNGERLADRR